MCELGTLPRAAGAAVGKVRAKAARARDAGAGTARARARAVARERWAASVHQRPRI